MESVLSGGVSSGFYGSLFTQNHQLLSSVASESQKTYETPPLKTVSIVEAKTCGKTDRDSTPGNKDFINKNETVLCVVLKFVCVLQVIRPTSSSTRTGRSCTKS